jgi:Ni,Fe-hydrogenase I cytochrome b subunit
MKSFIAACVAIVVIAVAGYFVLQSYQEPVTVAYTTSGVRL